MLSMVRLKPRGFIIGDHMDIRHQALAEPGRGIAPVAIIHRETVAEGLAAAPEAFIGLLSGHNFGKQPARLL